MTTTRPKRVTRHVTPAPIVEDDATIVRTCLDRILYTVDVMARFEQTRQDIVAVNNGSSEKTMAQVMTEVRWHEHATKARKECPLGSMEKRRKYEQEEEDDDDDNPQDAPSTSAKNSKTPKPTPEKKPTPSKAKLAAMKKKADAARRKAQRDAKKLAEQEGKENDEEDEEPDDGMPVLENATITELQEPATPDGECSEASEEKEESTENKNSAPTSTETSVTPVAAEVKAEEEPAPQLTSEEPLEELNEREVELPPTVRPTVAPTATPIRTPIENPTETSKEDSIHPLLKVERKPSFLEESNVSSLLYPLDFYPVEEDVPGRLWCPPREYCKATDSEVVGIGPLTELETLDLTLQSDALEYLLPETADLILTRMLELQIPALELKLLNPEMSQEVRENNIKQLEIYEKQLEECYDKAAMFRLRIANLPQTTPPEFPQQDIQSYEEFDPTWYSSSRMWFDNSIRRGEKVTQQDFLDQFEETDNQVVLDSQRDMIARAKAAEEEDLRERINNFKMPLVHDISSKSPIVIQRMEKFRLDLATHFQYEDFERTHMEDPTCQEIWKMLQPLPYENGTVIEEAEEELIALISSYKKQFGEENPVIPLPEADDEENETEEERKAAAKRFLKDVMDTVVFRELTELPTYPHRIPLHNLFHVPANDIPTSNSPSSPDEEIEAPMEL